MTQNEIKTELEYLIDNSSLTGVLSLLAEIAHEKASHIQENWQDCPLAKTWTKDAQTIEKIELKINN